MRKSGARPSGKRGGLGTKPAKKAKKSQPDDDGDAFFLADDDDRKREEEEDEDEEVQETADQLRLRLAREYLSKLQNEEDERDDRRGVTGGSDEEGEGEEGEDDDEEDEGARTLDAAARSQRLADRLQHDVAQAAGRLQRKLAQRVRVLAPGDDGYCEPSCSRAHRLAATAVCLTADDATAFTVSKDGGICRWDVETGKRTHLYRPGDGPNGSGGASTSAPARANSGGADWVARKARSASKAALAAVAVSSDGRYLAVGGGDSKVHVFEAGGSGAYVMGFPGHKDAVTGLVFREGTHTLMSCSSDRTVKLWSLDDRAYMDTLYGHQAEVLSIDSLRAERVLTGAHDHTCRMWKIPEESQLIFRAHDRVLDCVRFVTGSEWVSGGCDGGLHLWSNLKKKPVFVARGAHGPTSASTYGSPAAGVATGLGGGEGGAALGAEHGWINSVAVCRNSDLVASGAGDGAIRLWSVTPSKSGGAGGLGCIGALPQRGFVNGLAIARSARFLVAAVGQEPRMGRWAREPRARNGLAVHRLGGMEEQ
ncbi:hypothetical protein HXX76_004928 [Chlamydomonas incerta]|uniref:Uncharacterized protein n=1 Tax=Chlamydomonas incerta TaxID=51695 RepID=A0A835T8V5_CHLIN|nr:hypothetical protein HXX76_004928 [Chlamydomonas incerta]|eukprot:KAG2439576.1 hypothetical protein HXX76_004928 [Chlamydomonas incerta]